MMGEQHLDKKRAAEIAGKFNKAREEIGKVVIGQEDATNAVFRSLICNGHILIEGVPGIAKTLIMLTVSKIAGCKAKRIQFTPDLLPTDITGIMSYSPDKGFYTIKGPIFTNFVLADEINRAPAKVQSAMLEAMQERRVTIGTTTYDMERPFVVLATQNNIESLGVYQLPAAQLDRFMFKITMLYPTQEDEKLVLKRNISAERFEDLVIKKMFSPEEVISLQGEVSKVFCTDEIEKYIVSLVHATRQPKEFDISLGKYIEYGGSPRASISLYNGAKANALLHGRSFVTPQDVKDIAHDVLRHRVILNYEGQAEQIHTDAVIDEVLEKVRVP